jgi:hypothetical protein
MKRTLFLSALITIALSLHASPASAVVTDDQAASEATPTDTYSGFNWGGIHEYNVNGAGKTLTAVDPYWLVSSRHSPLSAGQTFTTDGTTYTIQEVVANPDGADLSLIRVDHALPVWYELYAGSVSTGGANQTEVLLIGTGHAGSVTDINNNPLNPYDSYTYDETTTRQRRWGTNNIDATESASSAYGTHDTLRANFILDDTTYEAGTADHDSGGGWFVDDDGTWRLVGVTWAIGGVEPNPPYEVSYAVDVRSYSTWVNQTIPEPATVSLLGIGGLALLIRRRRRRVA